MAHPALGQFGVFLGNPQLVSLCRGLGGGVEILDHLGLGRKERHIARHAEFKFALPEQVPRIDVIGKFRDVLELRTDRLEVIALDNLKLGRVFEPMCSAVVAF